MENEEGQECIQGKSDEKKWDIGDIEDRQAQREGPVDSTRGR